jgi:phenylacetate-CoA ligase
MNWRKPVYSAVLRAKGSVLKHLAEYERTQWYSLPEIQAYQRKRLERLLRHASQHVPYYRRIIPRDGLLRNGDVALERFAELPLLTKDILREHFDALKSDDLDGRNWYSNSSGGSTGEPARFIQDKEYLDQGLAMEHHGYRRVGKDLGDAEVRLWGSERDIFQGTIGLRAKLGNLLRNQVFLNAFRMSPPQMTDYIRRIGALRPKVIVAYAQSAYELSKFSLERSLPIHGVGAVVTSAGTLYPFMRDVISKAFHAPVFNRYGSREVGDIAMECAAHSGLHVLMENQFVEVLDEDGRACEPGKPGEIVVTVLTNCAMPLIRYRIGDVGVWADGSCTCGRGSHLLQEVSGRVVDVFLTKAGEKIDGEYFTHLIYFKDWVRKFQFVQESLDSIRVKIQRAGTPPPQDLKEIEDKVRLVMGVSCTVEFEFVDDIPPGSSGKYRYTISHVTGA